MGKWSKEYEVNKVNVVWVKYTEFYHKDVNDSVVLLKRSLILN